MRAAHARTRTTFTQRPFFIWQARAFSRHGRFSDHRLTGFFFAASPADDHVVRLVSSRATLVLVGEHRGDALEASDSVTYTYILTYTARTSIHSRARLWSPLGPSRGARPQPDAPSRHRRCAVLARRNSRITSRRRRSPPRCSSASLRRACASCLRSASRTSSFSSSTLHDLPLARVGRGGSRTQASAAVASPPSWRAALRRRGANHRGARRGRRRTRAACRSHTPETRSSPPPRHSASRPSHCLNPPRSSAFVRLRWCPPSYRRSAVDALARLGSSSARFLPGARRTTCLAVQLLGVSMLAGAQGDDHQRVRSCEARRSP